VVTAVNSAIRDVRAAMLLSTTGGDDEMNGSSWRSPTAKPSKPSCSASTALSTTSRSRSAGLFFSPDTGFGWCAISVSNRNFNAHPRHPAAWSLSRPQPHLVPAGAADAQLMLLNTNRVLGPFIPVWTAGRI
jgi:hypothetical protein